MTPRAPRSRRGFEVALICALELEADAVHNVFDKFWEDEGIRYGQAQGDNNVYTTGVIGEHNVVLAYLPGMGKAGVSAVSAGLPISFPSVKLALVVGICGGVPYDGPDVKRRIFLGDLVISKALVQYDLGRQYPAMYETKDTLEDRLGRPNTRIRSLFTKLQTPRYHQRLQSDIKTYLAEARQQNPQAQYPGCNNDQRFKSDYIHMHRLTMTSQQCHQCDQTSGNACAAALRTSCTELGCEITQRVLRCDDPNLCEEHQPGVHFGRIGSGDTVMKSGLLRDDIAAKSGIIAFEMEGAGVWDQLPSIVVKAVCDYADSHKSKDWQSYAAAVAAAGAKAFLKEWSTIDSSLESGRACLRKRRKNDIESDDSEIDSYSDGNTDSGNANRHIHHPASRKRRDLGRHDIGSGETRDNAIMASLAFPQMLERKNNIEAPHRQTCRWLFELTEYQNWQSQSSGLLWIKGKPGAGKSTIMSFLYDDIYKEDKPGIRLEFFFSARGTELQRTPVGMLRSLLNQLFRRDPSIRDTIRKVYQEKCTAFGQSENSWTWQRRELESLLANAIVESARRQSLTIIIDALDEAGKQVAPEIAHYFHEIYERVLKGSATAKICISCRHYPIVSQVRGIEVCVEHHNHNDISAFVQDFLRTEAGSQDDKFDLESRRTLAKYLVKRANGVFQWVHLVVPTVVRSLGDGVPAETVRRNLQQVPEQLEDVYEYIIQHVIDREYRSKSFLLFQWVCLATRPLSVTEMRFAIAANDAVVSSSQLRCCETSDFVNSDELMIRQIRAWSGGLLEVVCDRAKDTACVQVIHQSVNDFLHSRGLFLLDAHSNGLPIVHSQQVSSSQAFDTALRCHYHLYRCCLTYLTTEDCDAAVRDIVSNRKSYHNDNVSHPTFPLIRYATFNILVHAQKAARYQRQNLEEEFQLLDLVLERYIAIYHALDYYSPRLPHHGTTVLHIAAFANLSDVIVYCIRKGIDPNVQDEEGYTALHLAAQQGHLTVVELMYRNGANVDTTTRKGETPLVLAAGNGHLEVVQWLLGHDANLEASNGSLDTALQAAAKHGDMMVIRVLLGAGADVKAPGGLFGNALQAASGSGHQEVVELLLDRGADVNAPGVPVDALQAASGSGHKEVVQLLLDRGAGVNAPGGPFANALQDASVSGHQEVVQLLLDRGADVNAPGGYFGNALQAAAANEHEGVVQLLLDRGANVNAQGGKYGNALQAALTESHEALAQKLRNAGALSSM